VIPQTDVLIVGGGAIGCALARELAGRGRRVTLLDRGQAGEEASAAAAGLISPQSDFRDPGPLFELALESRGLYPEWTRSLEEETGQEVGYRRTGLLRCAFDEREEAGLAGFSWQRQRGLAVEPLDAGSLSSRAGAPLAPDVRAGVFFPDEGAVDPRRLTKALLLAARARGVEVREGEAARRFWIEGVRCLGVEVEGGRLGAEYVVDAAGAWAGFDQTLPFPVPIEPVRGQIVELDLGPAAPRTCLHSEAVYLVPRADGRVLVGSTLERVGYRKEVTAGVVEKLIDSAARLLPAVRSARFVTAWAGLRPGTPDNLPVLGACAVEGLLFAAGHYRNGILLAPITARLLADRLTGGAARNLDSFAVSRFGQTGRAGATGAPPAEVFR